jgi:hypothetical protein
MNLLSLLPSITKTLDKFVQDKDLKLKLEHELLSGLQKLDLAQIEVNKEEAKHSSLFVSGWRPFIGWSCGIAITYHAMAQPILEVVLRAFGLDFKFPEFDLAMLYPVLMGMLGLSASRSFEKSKGVARK